MIQHAALEVFQSQGAFFFYCHRLPSLARVCTRGHQSEQSKQSLLESIPHVGHPLVRYLFRAQWTTKFETRIGV
jgi:hypothetical protein